MKTKTFTLSIASLAILSLLAACGPKAQAPAQQSAQQSSTQQESSSSAATSASQSTGILKSGHYCSSTY